MVRKNKLTENIDLLSAFAPNLAIKEQQLSDVKEVAEEKSSSQKEEEIIKIND